MEKTKVIFEYVGDDDFYGAQIVIVKQGDQVVLCKVGYHGGENAEIGISSKERKVLIDVFKRLNGG